MKNRFRFVLILSAFFVMACQPREKSLTGGDPLEEAYRLIDQGKTTEAIESLEDLAAKKPTPKVFEALASAYAARAGIRIEKYWGAVVGFEAPLKAQDHKLSGVPAQAARVLAQLDGRKNLVAQDEFTKLAEIIFTLAEWKKRIDDLPVVPPEHRDDVEEALLILEDHPEAGGRLYRALLGLILLKSEILDGFDGWIRIEERLTEWGSGNLPPQGKEDQMLCVVDYGAFIQWGQIIILRLQAVAEDVIVAYPSKKKELKPAIQQTRRLVHELEALGGKACL